MLIYRLLKSFFFLGLVICLPVALLKAEDSLDKITLSSIDAENIETDNEGNIILSGKVLVKTNLLEFRASKAIYNESEDSLELTEEVEVVSTNLNISAKRILTNLTDYSFSIKKGSFNFKNTTFGKSEEIFTDDDGNIQLLNTILNNCSAIDPAWEIEINEINLITDENNAILKGIKFKIGKIPIFYFPFIRTAFGNERMSGFLSPSLRQGGDGLDLSIPYYLNLAPNYDLLISPRHITDRGSGGSISFRYLTQNSKGKLNIATILKDKEYKKDVGKDKDRWKISFINTTNLNNRFVTNINYKSTSDEYFFRDIGDDHFGEIRTSYLPREAQIIWKSQNFNLKIGLNRYQVLNPFIEEDFRSLPRVDFNSFVQKEDLSFSLKSSFTKFKGNDSNLFQSEEDNINRILISPEIRYKKDLESSNFTVALGTDFSKYKVESGNLDNSAHWLEAAYRIFLRRNAPNHVSSLIPLLKFIYVKNDDTDLFPLIDTRISSSSYRNLFRRNIYSGKDRTPEMNRLILGVEHSSYSHSSNLNSQLSLGMAFYLKDENSIYENSLRKNKSPIIAEFISDLSENLWSVGNIEWDYESNKVYSGSLGLVYNYMKDTRLEVKSIYRRKNLNPSYIPWSDREVSTKQFEVLFQWPMTNSWSLFGRVLKDLETSRSLDNLIGIQYSNCCLKIGLMNRKWIDEDYFSWQGSFQSAYSALSLGHEPTRNRDNTYIFIELKELGRLGKKISKVISSPILE